jgi:SAM-dependent methyltransferase
VEFVAWGGARACAGRGAEDGVEIHQVVGGVVMKIFTQIAEAISRSSRAKKHTQFMQIFKPRQSDTVLDVGYINEVQPSKYRNYLEKNYPWTSSITALGIEEYGENQVYPGLKVIRYDGKIFPFENKSFDIGFSNAVIEHVGTKERQLLFIQELCRTCKKVYLTTPNRYFPIETHIRWPFIHWLPTPSFFKLLGKTRHKGWIENLFLLGEKDLRAILDEAYIKNYRIIRNRFLGLCMTFSVIIGTEEKSNREKGGES